jgi:SAM-dependent methyltransferase
VPDAPQVLYNAIGPGYSRARTPDPRIASMLHAALGAADTVVNVGAGTGAYEPADRAVIAVEPSAVMLAQRLPRMAPAVGGRAEALPLPDRSVDAVLAVLTVHHWSDREAGLHECARVARERVVLLTWDPAADGFWLVQDYLPSFLALDRVEFPSLQFIRAAFGADVRVEVVPVPIPHDCKDGFLGAYWRRPASYLDPTVRASISSFARQDEAGVLRTNEALAQLAVDLGSGAWQARYSALAACETLDMGYRFVVAHLPQGESH